MSDHEAHRLDERQRKLYDLLIERGMDERRARLAVFNQPDREGALKESHFRRRKIIEGEQLVLVDGSWRVFCRRCNDEYDTGIGEALGLGREYAVKVALEQGWKARDGNVVCPVCRGG